MAFTGMSGWDDRNTMGTTGWSAKFIEPDTLLPSQYYNSKPLEPEAELVLAIFTDAISCIADRRTKPHTRLDAIEWFCADTPPIPYCFTFLHCCEILGYDAPKWRRWALAQHPDHRQFRRRSINRRIRNHQYRAMKQLHLLESIG